MAVMSQQDFLKCNLAWLCVKQFAHPQTLFGKQVLYCVDFYWNSSEMNRLG